MVPLIGAKTAPSVGLMAKPLPMLPEAKCSSLTLERSTKWPVVGFTRDTTLALTSFSEVATLKRCSNSSTISA